MQASRGPQPSVSQADESASSKGSKADAHGSPDTDDDDDDDFDNRETVPVDEALASTARLFVRGPAGSGKTTLLQWVAVMSASRSHTGALAEWNDRVPFFIKLREFAGKELPLPSIFPILIDRVALAESLPNGWVARQLESGRALVLIDGLDEMPQERREAVRLWIDSLVAEYPKSRFVITSRPYAAEEGWLTSGRFFDAELQDMTTPDVNAFIGHWHEAVKEGVQTIEEKDELDDLSAALLQTVKSRRSIHRLATSPLLCAMLCALHRERNEDLPSRRVLLYQACIDVFFRRDRERRISFFDYCEIKDDRSKQVLLADLAYWMLRNGWSMVSIEAADGRLDRSLRQLRDELPDVSGSDARQLMAERVGILRYPEPGLIDFPHRTFLEYLAAGAALDEGAIGELIRNAADDQWSETILLAAGLATAPIADKLVDGIAKAGDPNVVGYLSGGTKNRARLYLLAAQCLDAVVKFPESSRVEETVQSRIQKVIPPRTMGQAAELARAGDLAIPYLNYDQNWNQRTRNACVRTLSLIGSESALSLLATYVSADERNVLPEFWASWKHTADAAAHLRVIIPNFDGVSLAIHVMPMSEVSTLTSLTNLRTLDISDMNLSDVSALTGLTNLQTLDIRGTTVNDVSALASLTNLRTLVMSEVVNGLTYLPALTTIILSSPKVNDVSTLTSLTNILALDLSNTTVSDVSTMASLTNLQLLGISHVVDGLAHLPALTTVILRGSNLSDVSALACLTNLLALDLSNTMVSDVSVLTSLTNLLVLDLQGTSVCDVSALASLTNLRTLDLTNTKVNDVSALKSLVERGLEIVI